MAMSFRSWHETIKDCELFSERNKGVCTAPHNGISFHSSAWALKITAFTALFFFCALLVTAAQVSFPWENPPEKKILENGLSFIYQQDKSSSITVLQILIKGGKAAETQEKAGLAYLTTYLALEIPDAEKVQELMSQASLVQMAGREDYSLINISCLSENLEATLKIISQIMLKPLFSGIRIDRAKERMNDQRKINEDDAVGAGHNAALEALFAKTGYGLSVLGSKETIKAIKKKDIEDFHQNYFQAGNMVAVVISDLDKDPVLEILNKYLKDFPSGKPPEPEPIVALPAEEKKIYIEKDTEQFYVAFSFPLPKVSAKNFVLALAVENLLGKGVNSRLWHLRSEEKLAYNVNSRATQMREGGILESYLETGKEKKEVALQALRNTLNDLFENGVTEEELEVTKTNVKASFLRNNETKEERVRSIGFLEALGLGYEFLNKLFEEVDPLSLEEINAFIKDVLNPEKGIEIIVGPKIDSQNSEPKG